MYYLCIYYHVNKRDYILMGKLAELWRSPYPTFYQRWKAVVIPSAIIFLILYILQPFGISRIKGSVFGVVAGSALIAAGASGVFTYLLPALFPAYYKEQNWTLGKHVLNLLLMLLLIAVGIWAYQSWLMGMWLDKRLFKSFLHQCIKPCISHSISCFNFS